MSVTESPTIARAALFDLAHRARPGLPMHLLAWLLLGGAGNLSAKQPHVFFGAASVFLASLSGRYWYEARLAQYAARHYGRARAVYVVLLVSNPLTWGLISAIHLAQAVPVTTANWIWFTLGVVVAAAGSPFAIDRFARILYPAAALLPPVAVLVVNGDSESMFAVLAAVMFLVYLERVSAIIFDDYWSACRDRQSLEEHAVTLERLSTTDPLTQVANRLHFDRVVTDVWLKARRSPSSTALMMVDIDHFKHVNDRHGHAAGDRCLHAVAQSLAGVVGRHGDLVARYGGEEFVVLLPSTDEAGAVELARLMHSAVARVELPTNEGHHHVTCSIGVHLVVDTRTMTAQAAIEAADSAMYRAKGAGRNRIMLHEAPGMFRDVTQAVREPAEALRSHVASQPPS